MNTVFSNPFKRSYANMRPLKVGWAGLSFDAYSYFYKSYVSHMSEFIDIESNDISFKLVLRREA